jgi:hypothetical protein
MPDLGSSLRMRANPEFGHQTESPSDKSVFPRSFSHVRERFLTLYHRFAIERRGSNLNGLGRNDELGRRRVTLMSHDR